MFKYLVKTPEIISPHTELLLMLHGFGSNEADLFSFANQLPDDLIIISARAPIHLDFGGYAWYPIYMDHSGVKISDNLKAAEVLEELAIFVDKLLEKYHIQNGKINLLGFSQGAILSYALALNYPDKINNIIALSGYINEDIMPVQEKYDHYQHLDFFISHGQYDEIIPIALARKIPPYLAERKIKYTYKEYPMGHEVNMTCLMDMIAWVNKHLN